MNSNARGDVLLLIAENARDDSALTLTEIPSLMKNSKVDSILGISKKDLEGLSDVQRFELLKAKSLAMQSEATIYGGYDAEGNYYELMSFEGTSYSEKYNIVTKMPDGMTKQCTYVERLGEKVSLYTTEMIKEKYGFLGECTDTDIVNFKTYEYLISTGSSDAVVRRTGLMPDGDIKFKYEFLSDCTDTDILNRFRNYEYISANNIAKTTADVMSEMNIYIDTNGKLISLVEASSIDIPTDFACKVTLGDASHFLLDDVMESTYSFYKDLSAPEKIKFKEYDYHTRYTKLHLDKINISDATINKYLAATGKTADSLNAGDRYFMKMADALTSGDVDTVKWINKLSDSCKGISTIANVFLNGVDALGTIAIASISINNAVKLYNAGYENEASAIMTGCAVDIIGGVAGGAAITGAISPYLVGLGAAIGGPAGAAIGAVVAGVVGYGAAGLASSKVGEFVTENWDAILMTVEDVYGAVDEGVHDLYGLVLAGFDADADGAYFKGDKKDNFINAGEGNNKVDGFAGNDSIYGASGDDTMYGGEGNDTVCGDSGKDVLYGEEGNDTLIGGTGADIMYGGKGNDTYVWGAGYGTDRIYDSSGLNKIIFDGLLPEDIRVQYVDAGVMVINDKTSEVLSMPEFTLGSNYHNFELEFANGQKMSVDSPLSPFVCRVEGNSVNNEVVAYFNNSTLKGHAGNDTLVGSAGNDTMSGGEGDDYLSGGNGNDTLQGDAGSDYLEGGKGDDTYVILSGDGTDVIDDTDGTNTIKFADSTLEDVIVSVYGTNDAVMYSTTNGNMILLEDFRDIEGNELKLKFKDSEEMTAGALESPFLHIYGSNEDDTIDTFFDNGEAYGFGGNDLCLFINIPCVQDIFIRGCK